MKMHVEIDVTPEEARQFLGLPDVRPMQEAVMAHVQQQMTDAADRMSPEGLLRSWLTLLPQGSEQMVDMFGRFLRAPFGTGGRTDGG